MGKADFPVAHSLLLSLTHTTDFRPNRIPECGNEHFPGSKFSLGDEVPGTPPSLLRSLFVEEEEEIMPVFILWAVPTVIVLGGVSYYFLRVVH
jgi:hypothetical protein